MVARKGYKLTEVGEIPEDWEVVPLGKLGEALIGLTYSPDDVREFGALVLRSSNIQGNSLSFEDTVYVEKIIPDRIMTKKGDLLICVRNGSRSLIGKSVLLDDRADGSTFGAFMTVFRSQIGCLLSQLFQSELIKKQISEHIGATINQITNASLTAFCIPVAPTAQEQTAIATALSDADALIDALEQGIAKKRHIKQGAMQELLTGKRRLPGFEGEWKAIPLEAICSMRSGISITGDDISYNFIYPCFGGNGMRGYASTFTHDGEYVLIGRQGALCGNIVKVKGKFFASEHALVVTANLDVCSSYLAYIFIKRNLNQYAESSAQPGLSAQKLLQLQFVVPSTLDEQTAIAAVLTAMDDEIAALEAKLSKARQIKAGMMQELLTGRIRLV